MTLSVSTEESANPYAAPGSVLRMTTGARQLWSAKQILLWITLGCFLQAIFTVWVFSVLHQTLLGFIEPPYLHTILTIGFVFFSFFLLLHSTSFWSTALVSQVVNAIQWLTFVLTAWVLHNVGHTTTILGPSDLSIFAVIFLVAAVLLALLSGIVFRLRSRKSLGPDIHLASEDSVVKQ